MMSGVVSGLLRVVPAEGANICGTVVPGSVSCVQETSPMDTRTAHGTVMDKL